MKQIKTSQPLPRIIVDFGLRKQLAHRAGASYPTIRIALSGHVATPQHMKIREIALELGGVEVK